MATMLKTDVQLQKEVLDELRWDTRLQTTSIGVGVKDGIVTLTGTLSSWAAKEAASEAAHRVTGVFDVANDLQVEPGPIHHRTDAEIARAVREALVWDALVPDDAIRSTVEHGIVTLEGPVEYATEREDAARAVRNLVGVRAVVNRITLRPTNRAELQAAIERALERHVERELRHLHLLVHDGRVAVSGEVDSRAEREIVLGAIQRTAGVREIEDHLTVRA